LRRAASGDATQPTPAPAAWAQQHLRTVHLLQEEARRWDTNGPNGVTLELTS